MTADWVKGKGFRCALRYNLQKVKCGAAKILGYYILSSILGKAAKFTYICLSNSSEYQSEYQLFEALLSN